MLSPTLSSTKFTATTKTEKNSQKVLDCHHLLYHKHLKLGRQTAQDKLAQRKVVVHRIHYQSEGPVSVDSSYTIYYLHRLLITYKVALKESHKF